MIVLLMGVSGSGKTTIGTLLAARTGTVFADADDYHPDANRQKMAAGHALTDEDRAPWLATLNRVLAGWYRSGTSGVMACSALKASYRETLGAGIPAGGLVFVLLDGSKQMIADRLAARHHAFMNPQLLESQVQTLELPADGLRVVNDRAPEVVVDEVLAKLQAFGPGLGAPSAGKVL